MAPPSAFIGLRNWEWLSLIPLVLVYGALLRLMLRRWRKVNWRPHVGPLFWYELTRSARRGREIWLRCVYGSFLLIALFLVYADWLGHHSVNPWDIFQGASLPTGELPHFAGSFFAALMTLQLVAVILLTPVYTAGAIALEKEHRTLEFLLTTDLSDAEIVLGKLLARLATLALLLLTGLPVLSLMELWGGIDPLLVLAGFMVTAMTMLAVGSLCMLVSVHATGYLQAVFLSYFYLVVVCALGLLPILSVVGSIVSSGSLDVLAAVSGSALVFGAIAVWLCWTAVSQFRNAVVPQVAVRPPAPQSAVQRRPAPPPSSPQNVRVPVGESAMLWKELAYEQNITQLFPTGLLKEAQQSAGCLLVLCLALGCGFTAMLADGGSRLLPEMRTGIVEAGNLFVRHLGIPLTCLAFFVIALRAAGSISRERQRKTLESLYTTPLDREEILFAKQLGCILCVHPFWWVVGTTLVVGMLTGSLHILAVPLLAAAVMVYAALAAGVSLWCSSLRGSTLEATFRTVLAVLLLGGGAWLWSEYAKNFMASVLPATQVQWMERLLIYGLTPPVTLNVLAFHYGDFLNSPGISSGENLLAAVLGVVCYALLAWFLWRATLSRLRPVKDRVTKRRLRRAEADLQKRR